MQGNFFRILGLMGLTLAFGACHDHASDGHDHDSETKEAHKDAATSGNDIVLEPEMALRFGVECDTVRSGAFSEALKVSGRVLSTGNELAVVSAPTAGIVGFARDMVPGKKVPRGARIASVRTGATTGGDANQAAKAALNAAKRELDRLKPLYDQRLVTASEYNAALAAYESARAGFSASAASGAATAPISGVIVSLDVAEGQYVEAGAPLASMASDKEITLRVDLPRRMASRMGSFSDLRLALADGGTVLVSELGGKRSGASPAASGNNASAYVPMYFSVPAASAGLLNGGGFEGWLLGSGRDGVTAIPVSALSEQMGDFFVYERLDEDCYRKLPVVVGSSDGERVEVGGLRPGTVIVTQGVTTLRLSENAKAVPEGHSHNH